MLLTQPEADAARVAAIGYCFGGGLSLALGRSGADLQAIVAFHPGLGAPDPEGARNITAKVLVCLGTEDPLVPRDVRLGFEDEMKEGGVADWRIDLYGEVGHSFTNPAVDELGVPGIAFDATADARSWAAMLGLFAETIDLVR